MTIPKKQGLYDPQFEHENCGIGLIVDMKGRKSHDIVQGALEICVNLDHRGGCGCDPITGDGAGIFIQIPDKFFRKVLSADQSITLPPAGDYGVAFLFLSPSDSQCEIEKKVVEEVLHEEGIDLICWRKVPVRSGILGKASADCEPVMEQLFVHRPTSTEQGLSFERKLYLARRIISHRLRYLDQGPDVDFHACCFSSRTIVYKGMLTTEQLGNIFRT